MPEQTKIVTSEKGLIAAEHLAGSIAASCDYRGI
jgi:hypothetical protein